MEIVDLGFAIEKGQTMEMTAAILGREVGEVVRKAEELHLIQPKDKRDSAD